MGLHLSMILFLAVVSPRCLGAEIIYGLHKFTLSYPSTWKEVKDFFGIPITILGPMQSNGSRPVVQIVPIGGEKLSFSDTEVKQWSQRHDENSRKWMSKNGGILEEIWAGKLETRKDGTKQLVAGLSYRIGTKSFFEKIYYVSCPKGNFNIKILLNQGSKEFLTSAESIVGSFACGT